MTLLPPSYGPVWTNQASRFTHLRNLGFSPKRILDIGAYHGHWATLAKWIWPAVELLLIEANEECRPQLTAKGYPFEIALLDSTEREADYHRCTTGCGEGNGLFKENGVAPFITVKQRTRRLDDIVGDTVYDLVKLDCQGGELAVLEGGDRTLDRAHMVQLEVQVQDYNEGAPRILDVIHRMQWTYGFRLFDLTDFHYSSRGLLLQVDLLFAKADSPLFQIRPLS